MAESDPYELLLGRGTYEIFAAHWPYDEGPIADQLNSTRKHVASTTLKQVDWNNSTLITGDVAEYVAKLKRQDGPEIQVHGSPGLIQTLLETRPHRRVPGVDLPRGDRHRQAPLR